LRGGHYDTVKNYKITIWVWWLCQVRRLFNWMINTFWTHIIQNYQFKKNTITTNASSCSLVPSVECMMFDLFLQSMCIYFLIKLLCFFGWVFCVDYNTIGKNFEGCKKELIWFCDYSIFLNYFWLFCVRIYLFHTFCTNARINKKHVQFIM